MLKLVHGQSQMEIEPSLPVPRIRHRRKLPGEEAEDTPIFDVVQRFKVEFFYTLVDTCSSQIKTRFKDLHSFASKFSILYPTEFKSKSSAELEKQINELATIYQDDIDMHDVQSEFRVLKQHQALVNASTMTHGFFKNFIANGLEHAYPNVCTLYRLFLTLPITSVTVERSMSI